MVPHMKTATARADTAHGWATKGWTVEMAFPLRPKDGIGGLLSAGDGWLCCFCEGTSMSWSVLLIGMFTTSCAVGKSSMVEIVGAPDVLKVERLRMADGPPVRIARKKPKESDLGVPFHRYPLIVL